eukprot:6877210-Pyramimonas_sp.AAC.1
MLSGVSARVTLSTIGALSLYESHRRRAGERKRLTRTMFAGIRLWPLLGGGRRIRTSSGGPVRK